MCIRDSKKDLPEGKKMTYDLNYLEIPAVLKYKYEVDDHFSIQQMCIRDRSLSP